MAGPAAADHWSTRRERSNRATLALMAWIAVHLGRRVARLVLHPITLYFVLFSPAARLQMRRFQRRARGREPSWRELYAQVHAFASVVLDRVYLARGLAPSLDLQVHGDDRVQQRLAQGRGAFLLGAHLGSFEALHAAGKQRRLPVAMAMYPDNARMIHATLQAMAPGFELAIIAIGRPGSTLAIRDWLDRGGLVGLLGDRHIPHPGARDDLRSLPFLGQPARFTTGPLRLAQLLRRPVFFMVGLYQGGARYEVRFEPLADFSEPAADAAEREAQLQHALGRYVARLEALAREAPENWFNFHDFWEEDARL